MIRLRRHALFFSAAAAVAAVLVALSFRLWQRGSRIDSAESGGGGVAESRPSDAGGAGRLVIPAGMADAIAPMGGKRSAGARERYFTALSTRYRLAGFRINPHRRDASSAIIEDRETQRQWLRRVGEKIGSDATLAEVGTNSVVLSTPYGDCRLSLTRRREGESAPQARAPAQDAGVEALQYGGGAVAGLENCETSPGTWEVGRDDLMAYYDEVRHRPERLEAVFDTLAPVWYEDESDGTQKIEGYRVELCGEERFFAAMGFREGDVVREVNGIRMTNRYAAEELIRRFAAGDLEFAHIKMERDGEEIIQSYFLK